MFIPPKDSRVANAAWGVPVAEGWHEASVEGNEDGVVKNGPNAGTPKLVVRFCVLGEDQRSKARVEAHLSVGSPGFNSFLDAIAFDQGGDLEKDSLAGSVVWIRTVNTAGDKGTIFVNVKDFSGSEPS